MFRYITLKKIEQLNYFDEISLNTAQKGKQIQVLFSENVDNDRYYEADPYKNENYFRHEMCIRDRY